MISQLSHSLTHPPFFFRGQWIVDNGQIKYKYLSICPLPSILYPLLSIHYPLSSVLYPLSSVLSYLIKSSFVVRCTRLSVGLTSPAIAWVVLRILALVALGFTLLNVLCLLPPNLSTTDEFNNTLSICNPPFPIYDSLFCVRATAKHEFWKLASHTPKKFINGTNIAEIRHMLCILRTANYFRPVLGGQVRRDLVT